MDSLAARLGKREGEGSGICMRGVGIYSGTLWRTRNCTSRRAYGVE